MASRAPYASRSVWERRCSQEFQLAMMALSICLLQICTCTRLRRPAHHRRPPLLRRERCLRRQHLPAQSHPQLALRQRFLRPPLLPQRPQLPLLAVRPHQSLRLHLPSFTYGASAGMTACTRARVHAWDLAALTSFSCTLLPLKVLLHLRLHCHRCAQAC